MNSKIILLTDEQWSKIDGEISRVHDFNPMNNKVTDIDFDPMTRQVIKAKVISNDLSQPYASIKLECKILQGKITGFITNKTDFIHLWTAFLGLEQNEEVLIFWTKNYYKSYAKLFSKFLPHLWVMVCKKDAYELFDNNYMPELQGEARYKAKAPLIDWKPKVMI